MFYGVTSLISLHEYLLFTMTDVCPYSYKWVVIGKASDVRLTSCPQRMEHSQWDHRHVARLMRPLARLDQQLTVHDKIHFAQDLMKVVTDSVVRRFLCIILFLISLTHSTH